MPHSNAISGLILGVAGKDTIHKDAIARQLYHHFQCRCTNTSVTTFFFAKFKQDSCLRGVARGGAEGALAPPEFGRSVNPIQTRGADYTPHTTTSPPDSKRYLHLCNG